MHCLVQLRDRIFVKGYRFLYFLETWKKIGTKISKQLSSRYSQKLLDRAIQSATDALKADSEKEIPEVTGDLICQNIANRIAKVSNWWFATE